MKKIKFLSTLLFTILIISFDANAITILIKSDNIRTMSIKRILDNIFYLYQTKEDVKFLYFNEDDEDIFAESDLSNENSDFNKKIITFDDLIKIGKQNKDKAVFLIELNEYQNNNTVLDIKGYGINVDISDSCSKNVKELNKLYPMIQDCLLGMLYLFQVIEPEDRRL